MRGLRVLVTVAALSLLQTTLVPVLTDGLPWTTAVGPRPDLLLVFVAFLALGWPLEEAFLPCWLTGLVKDLLSSGQSLGAFAALYLVLAVGISRVRRHLFVEHIVTQMLVVGGAYAVTELVWLLVWFHPPGLRWGASMLGLLSGTLYTMLITPLALALFWILGWRWR